MTGAEPDFEAIRARLLEGFTAELGEHLEALRRGLARGLEGPLEGALWDELLRRLHSMKGASRMLGLGSLEELVHHLESVLERASRSLVTLSETSVDALNSVLDLLEDWFHAYRAGHSLPAVEAASLMLQNFLQDGPQVPSNIVSASSEPSLAGDRASSTGGKLVRLHSDTLERLLSTSAGLLTETLRQEELSSQMSSLRKTCRELQRLWNSDPGSQEISSTVDRLATLLREASNSQRDSTNHLNALGARLREEIRAANTVAASDILSGLGAMVRDLARHQQKEVHFESSGLELEAERRVLQELFDPLLHLLRNAVNHGLADSQDRLKSGKPARGRIWLRLEARSGQLEIEVGDDGRGMDRRAIAAEAERLGLGSAQSLLKGEDSALLQLAFHPRLSTSFVVSEVAGRGMGLSIVGETVGRLGGQAWVESTSTGTIFHLRVPIALSSLGVLLVEEAGQVLAIPSSSVEKLLFVPVQELENLLDCPALKWGDELLPVARLSSLLGQNALSATTLSIVILKGSQKRMALVVQRWLDHREVVVQSLNLPSSISSPMVAGGIILADSTIAFLLNVSLLFTNPGTFSWESAPEVTPSLATRRSEPATILVVDDSLTTRALQKSILETRGYRVVVATDGLEALEALGREKVDLVISDMQMPRMDGLGLLESIKANHDLAALPVILLSSVDRPEEIRRGLDLGADAYVIKAEFDQKHILELIQQLL